MAPPSHGQLSGCSCWTLRGSGLAYRSASRSPALVATGATRLDACLRVFSARGRGATLSISGATPMVRLDGHMSWPPDRGMAPPMRCHSPLRIAMEYLGVWRCYGTGWGSIEARPGTLRYNASRDYGRACALRRPAAFLAFPSVFSCQGAEWRYAPGTLSPVDSASDSPHLRVWATRTLSSPSPSCGRTRRAWGYEPSPWRAWPS